MILTGCGKWTVMLLRAISILSVIAQKKFILTECSILCSLRPVQLLELLDDKPAN